MFAGKTLVAHVHMFKKEDDECFSINIYPNFSAGRVSRMNSGIPTSMMFYLIEFR